MNFSGAENLEISSENHVKEEAILDSLFYACDLDESGRVPVSRLITYLRNAVAKDSNDNPSEFVDKLDDLSLILDPEGQDVHIGITKYLEGITEWIDDIRRASMLSPDDASFSPVTVNCTSPMFEPIHQNGIDHVTSTPNISSESVEGIGGESPKKNDWDRAQEMMSTIESLQSNNKRLLEQYTDVQKQMEQTDDLNAQLSAEVVDLKKQCQNLQNMGAKYKELERENIELRLSGTESQEMTKSLQNRNSLLEKEKQTFERNIELLNSKLTESEGKVDYLLQQQKELAESIGLQKQVNVAYEELQNVREELAEESTSKTDYLSNVIAELSLANEELKVEKSKLEEDVFYLNNELARVKQLDSSGSPGPIPSPYSTSTPLHKRKPYSLKQELQAQLTHEPRDLPSPLIGSSICNDSLDSNVFEATAGSIDQSGISAVSHDSAATNVSIERYSMIAFQVASEFKEKRDHALQQITELAGLDKSPAVKEKQEVIKIQLNQEMDQFAEKINLLCLKKKTAEKRSAKLLIAVKKLKEEHKLIQEERDKAYQKLGNLSLNTDEIDSRMANIKAELSKEKGKVQDNEATIKTLVEQLANIHKDLATTREEKDNLAKTLGIKSEEREELERKLIDAHKSQSQLDIQQTHQILRVKELEHELSGLLTQLSMEKQRTAALEESLHLSVSRHSNEMQEIMDMIPFTETDINRNKQSPRSSSPRVTGHTLRSRLQDYISIVQAMLPPQGAVRDSPDGKPRSELDESSQDSKSTGSGSQPPHRHATQGLPSPLMSSVSSQSPDRSAQCPDAVTYQTAASLDAETPDDVFRETTSTGSQTDLTSQYLKYLEEIHGRKEVPGEASDGSKAPKNMSLWKNKLAVSFKQTDAASDDMSISLNSSNFVDGISLHVRPAPTEKEIEKHFRTLVVAFNTDQMTLAKRLEVQERNRRVAESSMDTEFQNMMNMLKEYEVRYIRSKELQQVATALGSQLEVLHSSCQRVSSLAQQHGSVQQEARMASGLEVMICHAENVSRHMERARVDLNEFRKKESLQTEDSDICIAPSTSNGPTRLGGYGLEHETTREEETSTCEDNKQNSLANFMMAIHNTSVRAKQVLHNFRRRTIDAGTLRRGREEEPYFECPEEGEEGLREDTPGEEGQEDVISPEDEVSEDSAEEFEPATESVEHTRVQKRGVCRRMCVTLLRVTLTTVLLVVLFILCIAYLNEYTAYKIHRDQVPEWILGALDPVLDRIPPSHRS